MFKLQIWRTSDKKQITYNNMKITKKFEVTVTLDTGKANINWNRFGPDYDTKAYPNWQINFLDRETEFIKNRVEGLKDYFKFTGMKCKVREVK